MNFFERFDARRRFSTGLQIQLGDEGFRVIHSDGSQRQLRWTEIRSIVAYKADHFTIDQVRLEFIDKAGASLTLTEDDEGFPDLTTALPEHLPGVLDNWPNAVLFPAFEPRPTIIFERL